MSKRNKQGKKLSGGRACARAVRMRRTGHAQRGGSNRVDASSLRGKSIADFLTATLPDPSWRGGSPCHTCANDNAKAINIDLRAFVKAKKEGHPMPWSVFVRRRLGELYKLNINAGAVIKHARKCLELDI